MQRCVAVSHDCCDAPAPPAGVFGCRRAVVVFTCRASAEMERAAVAKAKTDLEGALHDLNEVIALEPQYSSAYNNRYRRSCHRVCWARAGAHTLCYWSC